MSFLTRLRKNKSISWTLFVCFTLSHVPLIRPMAAPVIAPHAQAALAAFLGWAYKQADQQRDTQRLLSDVGLAHLQEDLVLAIITGDMQQLGTLCTSYQEKLSESSHSFDSAAFVQHIENLQKRAPSYSTIYNLINSAAQRKWATAEQEKPRVLIPPYEDTHEQSIPTGGTINPSFPAPKPGIPRPPRPFIPPVHPNVGTYDNPPDPENKLPEPVKPPFNPDALPKSGFVSNVSGLTAVGIAFYELIASFYKASTRVKEQKHLDEQIDKAFESNTDMHALYKEAMHSAITITLKAHCPYSTSSERNHALLAMNHIGIIGRAGRYITQFIQTLNPYYFHEDGSLKHTRSKIDYEHAVDRLIPLMKKMATNKEEYREYLAELETAFHLESPEARKKFPKIYQKIQRAFKSGWAPHQESDFLNTLYEMLPKDVQKYGTIHPSVIQNNPHNKAFISFINDCNFDITDPQADPLAQAQKAKEFYESYGKHQTLEEKLSFIASNPSYIKQYQTMMRNFFQEIVSSTFDGRNIPYAFENDPYASQFSTADIKDHIKQLAVRYHFKKNIQAQFSLEGFNNKEIEQLLYAFITPTTTRNYTELPSSKAIIDHLVDGSTAKRNAIGQTLFNQFFTTEGILRSLEEKAHEYPELAQLNALTQKNKDVLRYTNYFLALDSTPETKKHIAQGIGYLAAASRDTHAASDYLRLARAHYAALTNTKGCADLLECGNFAQLYKNAHQNGVQNLIRKVALEGLTLQEKSSAYTSQEEQHRHAILSRYALKTAHIAHQLNARGKSEDARTMALNVLELLKDPQHSTQSFEVLVDIINKVSSMPGAFDPASLICTALRRDLDECKPDLIKKAHTETKKFEEALQADSKKINPGNQRILHEKLKAAATQAQKVLDRVARYPDPQGMCAAVNADLLRRLSQEAHARNVAGHTKEAIKLFNDFAPGLIEECEAYDKNKQDKPQDTSPIKAPQPASPKGTCQAEVPKTPAPTCGTSTRPAEKAPSCGTGAQEHKEPKPRPCGAGQQVAPSFGPSEDEVIGKAIEKLFELIEKEKSQQPVPQQPQNEEAPSVSAPSKEQDSTQEKEPEHAQNVPSKVIPAVLPVPTTTPALPVNTTAPISITPIPVAPQTSTVLPSSNHTNFSTTTSPFQQVVLEILHYNL